MKLPEELLQKISEFSSFGFALFIAQEHGVDTYFHADNELAKSAISNYALKLLSAQDAIDDQIVFNGLIKSIQDEEKAHLKEAKKRRKKG